MKTSSLLVLILMATLLLTACGAPSEDTTHQQDKSSNTLETADDFMRAPTNNVEFWDVVKGKTYTKVLNYVPNEAGTLRMGLITYGSAACSEDVSDKLTIEYKFEVKKENSKTYVPVAPIPGYTHPSIHLVLGDKVKINITLISQAKKCRYIRLPVMAILD